MFIFLPFLLENLEPFSVPSYSNLYQGPLDIYYTWSFCAFGKFLIILDFYLYSFGIKIFFLC